MVNPTLKTIHLKHGRGTRYQLVATGAHGMKLFRFISASDAAAFGGRKSSRKSVHKRRSHSPKRRTSRRLSASPKRRTTRRTKKRRTTTFGLF